MINTKEFWENNINEVNEILNDEEVHKYLNIIFNIGVGQYKKRRRMDGGYEVETYLSSKAFSRVEEIGNIICNKKELWPKGVSADVILAQNIPILKIKSIALTLKSTKNNDSILRKPADYMKKYSKLNSGLTPQISIEGYNAENYITDIRTMLNAKYYGILTYKLSGDNRLENMQVIFLSENANSIVHRVDIPIILFENKIIPENKSLKKDIELAKGESLRRKIELK